MAAFAFPMPVVPGKEQFDAETLRRMSAPGPERDAYVAARRSQGIAREAVWHQKTPMGTFAIVLLEGDDLAASFGRIALVRQSLRGPVPRLREGGPRRRLGAGSAARGRAAARCAVRLKPALSYLGFTNR